MARGSSRSPGGGEREARAAARPRSVAPRSSRMVAARRAPGSTASRRRLPGLLAERDGVGHRLLGGLEVLLGERDQAHAGEAVGLAEQVTGPPREVGALLPASGRRRGRPGRTPWRRARESPHPDLVGDLLARAPPGAGGGPPAGCRGSTRTATAPTPSRPARSASPERVPHSIAATKFACSRWVSAIASLVPGPRYDGSVSSRDLEEVAEVGRVAPRAPRRRPAGRRRTGGRARASGSGPRRRARGPGAPASARPAPRAAPGRRPVRPPPRRRPG